MGVVYMRHYDTGIEWERKGPPDTTRMPDLMKFVAKESGVAEFAHAPWITFGKSSRGSFPFRAAWHFPERTIATISYHGETPTWPVPDWVNFKGQTILEVNANGETEWGGTWFNHVRPSLLNYRGQKGWLAHQVVAKGVGHGDYPDETSGKGDPTPRMRRVRIWEYLALFVDKALELRVPKDKYPTDGPIELRQVDEAGGYLIDPFAVEDLFGVPRLPLREENGVYLSNPGDAVPVSGFAALAAPKDYTAPEGVPVVKFEPGKSPRQWILTESLKYIMKADPINEAGGFARIMPKPGDQVTIDDKTATFTPITPKQVGKNGGIAMASGRNTMMAFTVVDIPEKRFVKVQQGFTAATRIQIILGGVPVRHKQVLELQPGKYPMLVVVRMGVYWDRIEPSLAEATEAEVAMARQMQAEEDKRAAEEAAIKARGVQAPKVPIHKAVDVPKEKRARMFWVADKEQADAWLDLHANPLK
jgi:hypothetical protein